MAEPPAKRPRHADSSTTRNETSNPSSSRRDRDRSSRTEAPNGERHDRDSVDTRRDRERSNRDERNGDRRTRGREDDDRVRRRDRSRSRDRARRDEPRHRSRSPPKDSRNGPARTRSPPRGPRSDRDRHRDPPDRKPNSTNGPSQPSSQSVGRLKKEEDADVKMGERLDDLDEESLMLKIMGFGGFKSTKNTKVPGNDKNYGVRKEKKSTYRQYMNRQGGFNRPLSPS